MIDKIMEQISVFIGCMFFAVVATTGSLFWNFYKSHRKVKN